MRKALRWADAHKKTLAAGGSALAILALFLFLTPVGGYIRAAAVKRDLPIYCVDKNDAVVSLTFDAAWGNEDTEELISILGKYEVRATFFIVGEWVDAFPESVQALFEAGHEIMNHSNSHPHMTELDKNGMTAEIETCADKIEAITGVRPDLFRPPYGDYNDAVVGTLRELGCFCIQWDVDSLDWKNKSAEQIASRVLEQTKAGSIVLFHNAAENTPEALPILLEGLIQKGYTFLPVSELIYREDFTIDHAGKQVPNGR